MELAPSIQNELLMAIFFAFVSFISYFLLKQYRRNISEGGQMPPEAKGAWPLIGHLHILSRSPLLHKTLSHMADLYGPIFTFRIGVKRTLVVSSWEIAKECLYTNEKVFLDRPKTVNMEIMGYNQTTLAFIPYGLYWREQRKLAVQELFTNQRIETLKPIRVSEIRIAIKEMYDHWMEFKDDSDTAVMEMKNWFGNLNMNMTIRMVAGKRLPELDGLGVGCREAFKAFFSLATIPLISDSLPFLRRFDISEHKKTMRAAAKKMDSILQSLLEEHKRKREKNNGNGQQDFIDALLSVVDGSNPNLPQENPDTIIKTTCLSIIAAGSDTPTVMLTWALSLVLNNRHVLKKAQDELDQHVGRERQVTETDTKDLVYLHAIVKEAMRLYPGIPIFVRESVTDCVIAGYHVPARTRLMINLMKLQRDSNVWHNPTEFVPERFLTNHQNIDVSGRHFELIPFGSGRRICVGGNLATQIMMLALASLLQGFDIGTPSDEPVDMTESPGLSNLKATPLDVCISPRLPAHVYSRIHD